MDVYLLSDMNMVCHEGKPSQRVYTNCCFREVLILKDNNRDMKAKSWHEMAGLLNLAVTDEAFLSKHHRRHIHQTHYSPYICPSLPSRLLRFANRMDLLYMHQCCLKQIVKKTTFVNDSIYIHLC